MRRKQELTFFKVEVESSMYTMGFRWIESTESRPNIDEYDEINCMVLNYTLNISIINLYKGRHKNG